MEPENEPLSCTGKILLQKPWKKDFMPDTLAPPVQPTRTPPIAQLHRRSPWLIRLPGMRKESVGDDIEILVTKVNNLHDQVNTQDTGTARTPLEEARLIWRMVEKYKTDALLIEDALKKSRNHNPRKAAPKEQKIREVKTVLRTIGIQAEALLRQHGFPGAASGNRPAQTAQATANDATERASADRNSLHDSAGRPHLHPPRC